MNLVTYYQISISVLATLAVIMFLFGFVFIIIFTLKVRKLMAKAEDIMDLAHRTTENVELFVNRTIDSAEYYKQKYSQIVSWNFLTRVITRIILNRKGKGETDE